jgi:membrane-associated phospholipid phosphatase
MHTPPALTTDARRSAGSLVRFLVRASVSALLVTAASGPAAVQAAPSRLQTASESIEPGAGAWPTWLLTSGSELRLGPPPASPDTQTELVQLREIAAQRDGAALDRISYWDASAPAYRWNQRAVKYTQAHGVLGNRAMRMLALMNVAIDDATVAAWDSKYAYNRPRPSAIIPSLATIPSPASPSYPDEHAVAAGAASTVLAYVFPADAELFQTWADEAARSRLEAGVAYPSDVSAGLDLGRRVGDRAVAWGSEDGSDAKWTGSVPTESGHWKGTNPIEPLAGTWKTWTLSSNSQFRPGPPPAPGSEQMARELAEVKDFPRTNLTNLTASFWEYYGGRAVFEFWNDQASRAIFDYHLNGNTPRATRIYAATNVALHDSMVACFDAKYTYWAPRPAMLDPTIVTVFVTPNHPSYPSAHSCLAGSVSTVLGAYFPRDAGSFTALADQASEARIMGGIHYRTDLTAGLTIGHQVGTGILTHTDVAAQ